MPNLNPFTALLLSWHVREERGEFKVDGILPAESLFFLHTLLALRIK